MMKTPILAKILLGFIAATLLVVPFPAAMAAEPMECGLNEGDQLHGRDHDQIKERDRLRDYLLGTLMTGTNGDRLRTRDRLRDCEPIIPTASEVTGFFWNQDQNGPSGNFPSCSFGFTPLPYWLF